MVTVQSQVQSPSSPTSSDLGPCQLGGTGVGGQGRGKGEREGGGNLVANKFNQTKPVFLFSL